MNSAFLCPQCNQPIQFPDRFCAACGADLVLGEPLWRDERLDDPAGHDSTPVTPEILVPRLGDYLLAEGKITPADLTRALEWQRDSAAKGNSILIGRALRDLQLVDAETLDEAITVQILQLQSALQQANTGLQKRVQERTIELRRALDRLTELNQIKANFIANISHELRTPLTMLKGYLDMMSDGAFGAVTGEQAEAIDALLRAENRLEKLIEDLILFAYTERGELTLSLLPTPISELIQNIVVNAAYKARAAAVTIETNIQDNLPLVRCDREKIAWVLDEFLTNAIKFTPHGGRVGVECFQESGFVTTRVMDTGIGIPEERLMEIFEPFHQLDGTSTRRYGGTGLGLALSARILEAHGSHVHVKSQLDHGSKFEFSLPAVETDHEKEEISVAEHR